MKGSSNKCGRCKKWHQKLIHIYDNIGEGNTTLCLSCIAELIAYRLPVKALAELALKQIVEEKL